MTTLITYTDLKCPYCGFENRVAVEVSDLNRLETFYCSIDDGGCDRAFVFKHTVRLETEILKVEGQAEIKHVEELEHVQ